MTNNNEQWALTTYVNESLQYAYDHPYQTTATVVGTALVGYGAITIIPWYGAYSAAKVGVATAYKALGGISLADANTKLLGLQNIATTMTTQILSLANAESITDSMTYGNIGDSAQSYINSVVADAGIEAVENNDATIESIINLVKLASDSTANQLSDNIADYTYAAGILAAAVFPTVPVIATVVGGVMLTVSALDMAGVIDLEGYMPHFS